MRLEGFDWKNPDYAMVFQKRIDAIGRIREHPEMLPDLKSYYRENIADFIEDFGVTVDPRLVERGLPAVVPFVLFPRQREWVEWLIQRWKTQTPGITEKSRDCGLTWLAVETACTLCLFYDGMEIGFGSRKQEYVDAVGSPKAILPKARTFLSYLPIEFRGGWRAETDAPFMRINFPETGSHIGGESGDQIGRGDRKSIYMIDEDAYLEHADRVDAALSQTTNCHIDISSVNGMNNTFAKKRHSGRIDVFIFDWKSDPRKDQAWYEKQCAELDPVVVAQEIDRDYTASVEGIVIPGAWVRACVDALKKLGRVRTGSRMASLDVADEGGDLNAWGCREGVELIAAEQWSGKNADIFATTERAFRLCEENNCASLRFDADGLGAGARGDARVINERRAEQMIRTIPMLAFRGSGAVVDPDGQVYPGGAGDSPARTNKDFFLNCKSQSWWGLRERVRKTWRWVVHGKACDPDEIISFDSAGLGLLLPKILTELSQPTYSTNGAGKIVIEKTPDGMKSPNLADMVMMLYGRGEAEPMVIPEGVIQAIRARGAARMAGRRRRW